MKIIVGNRSQISTGAFDAMNIDEQETWCEEQEIPLAYFGDLSRYASGIPGDYMHVSKYLAPQTNDGGRA